MLHYYVLVLSVVIMFIISRISSSFSHAPSMSMDLKGKVCVVTGASRGIGRGIALALGDMGATVYVTGRSESLRKTADDVTTRGGKGIPVVCDHSNDEEIKALFERVSKEEGKLHILVNNCFSAVTDMGKTGRLNLKFWEKGPGWWDTVNRVGLRAHFIASQHAVPLMLPAASAENPGLIVTVSSAGGLKYLFDVAYGTGKAAKDRMARDMAVELHDQNIASVSLWPGAVKTELIQENILSMPGTNPIKTMFENGESVEYPGRAVAALARDKNVMKLTGRTFITADLGDKYGFTDVDGRHPRNLRNELIKRFLVGNRYAWLVPEFLKVPFGVLDIVSSKFRTVDPYKPVV